MHYGRLIAYNGDKLYEIGDPLGTPTSTVIYDDGMGPDMCSEITRVSTDAPISAYSERLAIATTEGIWIAKNVEQEGGNQAFVTRVDRTSDGTNVGVPVATLPTNSLVLDIAFHLGSLILFAASDVYATFGNDISTYGYPLITLYHLTNDSLGTIGIPTGGLEPTESPYHYLGAEGPRLYFSSAARVWMWDAVRGGFHVLLHDETVAPATYGGLWSSMAFTSNAGGDRVQRFTHTRWSNFRDLTISDKGESSTTHTLESNYIDGNLPGELKSLVGITLMTDGIKTNETWTISIEPDDGSFASAAVFNTVGAKTTYKALAAAVTGYRFRYKIVWTASVDIATPSRVKGIILHMVQGEMVTAWQLTLDLSEVRSIENTVLRPEDAVGSLETLMAKQVMTTYVDEMRVASTTHDVRVDSVQVSKDAGMEGEAVVVLTEQDLA